MKFRTTLLTAVALSLPFTGSSQARTTFQEPAAAAVPSPQDQIAPATQTTPAGPVPDPELAKPGTAEFITANTTAQAG